MDLASIIPALQEAWPVIVSLVILEGLLSVDNAMVIAAMVQHLPGKQKDLALKLGILGAYVMRGLALVFCAWIVAIPGLHLIGGLYLIHLMTSHLGVAEEGEASVGSTVGKSFIQTVIAVEIADMMFSIDNVVAAVAMSNKLWVVIAGVFLGILAMRFVAGFFVKLIEKFPILNQIAFLLVGFVGVQLCVEQFFPHFELTELQKFGGIVAIIAGGLIYDRSTLLQKVFGPLVRWIGEGFGNINELVEWAWKPFGFVIHLVVVGFKKVFRIKDKPSAEAAEQTDNH